MIGHNCQGGGAKIENSPINLHIHIHTEEDMKRLKVLSDLLMTMFRGVSFGSVKTDDCRESLDKAIEALTEHNQEKRKWK